MLTICFFLRDCVFSLCSFGGYSGSGGALGRGCRLVGRGAAALVEGIGGVLSGAGHHVAVDPAVQLNHRGLGGH